MLLPVWYIDPAMKTKILLLAAMSLLMVLVTEAWGQDLPKPKLRLVGVSEAEGKGYRFKLYELEIVNREEFDNELFTP